ENDLAMIRNAGLGIAMGNATDELKAQAGLVTATNMEDGVAIAVERLLKEGC
ncbi:MAG: HAD hydrolase family protein, partial [Succinivibrio sp.]